MSPNSLRINYFNNDANTKLTSVTFRVRYGGTPVTITDTGEFDPKKSVTHQFNQLGGLPWAGANAQICRVLTATFADGRVMNPRYLGPDPEVPGTGGGTMPEESPGAMPATQQTPAAATTPAVTPTP